MLKTIALGFSFIVLLLLVAQRGEALSLSFYIFFPTLICLFFLLDWASQKIIAIAGICFTLIYVFFMVRHASFETLILGAGIAGFLILARLYRRHWAGLLQSESARTESSRHDLALLTQKYHSRLESLHHLEKQVAGLLALFEIARDFNDCLSFESIQEIFLKRVLPELPFTRLRLFLVETGHPVSAGKWVLEAVNEQNYHPPEGGSLTEEEQEDIEAIRQSRRLFQKDGRLIFPLLADGEMTAAMLVEGSHQDDLAKFEVLAAYMALQVRKIRLYETVRELSIRDGLTGVFVRRHFMERFDEEIRRSLKYNLPLALLMLDIDLFKRYNDAHGHLAGDATLKQVAQLLRESLRKVDTVARYGGEEFIVVIPETRKAGALEVAERIRSGIARHEFKVFNDQTKVTISIGVSLFPDDVPETMKSADPFLLCQELVQSADKALYRAKEEGRNRVIFFQDL